MKKNYLLVLVALMVLSFGAVAFWVFTNQEDEVDEQDSIQESTIDQNSEKSENFDEQERFFTLSEVSQHDNENDCYVVYENKIYDVTDYAEKHPGGAKAILENCGKDITTSFDKVGAHQSVKPEDWAEYYKGTLQNE